MLFTSLYFILFVAILFAVYYAVPRRVRWPVLLLASYVFYWFSGWQNLIFITVTSVTAWAVCLVMGRIDEKTKASLDAQKDTITREEKKKLRDEAKSKKRLLMAAGLLIDLGILAVTKYTDFVIDNINAFLDSKDAIQAVDIIVPMGISFYTFQTVSYIIDCSRGTVKPEKNIFKVLLFTAFFPQLVQGPISRWKDLSATLFEGAPFSFENFSHGLMRIMWGYFKKLIVADRIIVAVNILIKNPERYTGAYVFCAMMFYAFELYCDFTGGIDITIGIAKCLGITVKENFDLPYFSKNIKEYWNRWHITMGTWFTDYIFYPLSVSPKMLNLSKWSRKHLGNELGKRVSVYISCFLVWLATGIWHGPAWNFVVWGLLNFLVIMVSQELEPLYSRFHNRFHLKGRPWYSVFEIIRTILLMSMIRMLDCYRNVPLTFKMLGTMFTGFRMKIFNDGSLLQIGLEKADYIILLAGLIVVFSVSLYKAGTKKDIKTVLYEKYPLWCLSMMVMLLAVVVFGAYGKGYDSTQFIYNQF